MKYLKETTSVPWFGENGLHSQLGSESDDNHKGRFGFKINTEKALKQVLAVYPEARVESTPKGLLLRPSPTHIIAFSQPGDAGSDSTAPVSAAMTPAQNARQIQKQIKELAAQRSFA